MCLSQIGHPFVVMFTRRIHSGCIYRGATPQKCSEKQEISRSTPILRHSERSELSMTAGSISTHPALGLTLGHMLWRETRVALLDSLAEGELMSNLKGLVSVVSQLREERTNLVSSLRHVDAALSVLGRLNGRKTQVQPTRTISASGRRRIATAQKARWAKVKAQNVASIAKGKKPGKRTMSASARRKIAAAQRARWARVKRAA